MSEDEQARTQAPPASSPEPAPDADWRPPEGMFRWVFVANVLLGVVAFVVFFLDLGFSMPRQVGVGTQTAIRFVLGALVAVEFLTALTYRDRRQYFRERRVDVAIAVFALLDLVFGPLVYNLLFGGDGGGRLPLVVMMVRQLIVSAALLVNALRFSRRLSRSRLSPGWLLISAFAALIALGTVILKLPNMTVAGISWLDALFTATSAVTVTGLIVLDTSADFTFLGQLVILFLLQIGGLGVMTVTYFVAVVLRHDLSSRDRVLISEIVSERNVGEGVAALWRIVITTLVVEAIGALLLLLLLRNEPHAGARTFSAVFHAVSAFCNAGFSVYRDSLADPRTAGNAGFQIVMMILIVLGGLGFPVLKEAGLRARMVVQRMRGLRSGQLPELSVHSRLTLWTTAALLIGGALTLYVAEFLLRDGTAAHSQALTASFASVTARTAGFSTVDTGALGSPAAVLLLLLMVIGGSPTSTAGGARTTTLAVAVLNMRLTLQDRPHLTVFGTRLPDRLAGRAFAIVSLALVWNGAITFLLSLMHPGLSVLDLAFETVSAFATVGLSRGITTQLTAGGKLLIILTMFAGRVGILSFVYAIVPSVPHDPNEDRRTEPILL